MNYLTLLFAATDVFWIQLFGFLTVFVTSVGTLIVSLKNKNKIGEVDKKVDGHMSALTEMVSDSVKKDTVDKIINKIPPTKEEK